MPLNILIEGDVVVLSNFGRLMNDPRHMSTCRRGYPGRARTRVPKFVLDLGNVRETGSRLQPLVLLMTITRRIQRQRWRRRPGPSEPRGGTSPRHDANGCFLGCFPQTSKEAIESFGQEPRLSEPE